MYFPKINGPYYRFTSGPNKNKFDLTRWSEPEFEYLQHNEWYWLEKLDGTNTFINYKDGEVSFHGRTANAQLPKPLLARYEEKYTPELLHSVFQDNDAIVYMEGVGPKIQGGAMYGDHQHGVVIDVRVGGWWLRRDAVEDVANRLDTSFAQMVGSGTLHDAISVVSGGLKSLVNPEHLAEGLIIRPMVEVLNRAGNRVTTKIKHIDFYKE